MRIRSARVLNVVGFILLIAADAHAQDTRPSEQVYRNIKVMQGVPANQLIEGMHVIKAALGVDCTHCHVEGQWYREDVQPMKDRARAMFMMMTEINRANFGGRQVVTCYTCHKGHAIPENVTSLPAPPIEPRATSMPMLPTVDQILAKYVTALGGEAAMRKVTTRVITATQDIPTGPGGTVPTLTRLERSLKAPNLVVDVYTGEKVAIADGFDGQVSWGKAQNGVVSTLDPAGADGERALRASAFYEPLMLKQEYRAMTVEGAARVNDRDTYVVIGIPANGMLERLYFDVNNGLLVRKWTYLDAVSSRSPFQMDFDEYRDTGSGVKIPFVVRMSPAGPRVEIETASTLRVTSVKDNQVLDEAKFVKPASIVPARPQ